MMAFTAPGKPWLGKKMNEAQNQVAAPITGSKEYRIRTFNFSSDFIPVINLWADAGPGIHLRRSDEAEEIQKKLQRDADLFLVAELDNWDGSNNRIIGAVMGGFDGRRGMVYHLAVAKTHRKLGIARMLMEELENRMRTKGCIRSYLLVTADNLEAIRFYEAQNWQRMELFAYGKDLV
jgi:ribosomal protein S18 acetylase RimI-like enzyme